MIQSIILFVIAFAFLLDIGLCEPKKPGTHRCLAHKLLEW